jgi:hypothetical protein
VKIKISGRPATEDLQVRSNLKEFIFSSRVCGVAKCKCVPQSVIDNLQSL